MFFTVASTIMLAGVLAGFAPTFFLRPLYFPSALSPHLVVHGAVSTLWFLLFAVQSYLAETRRLRWHRPLGWAGMLIAALMLITAPPVLIRSVPNGLAAGLPGFAVSFVFMTGVARLVFFAAMIAVAIRYRRTRAVHSRALFMASLSNFAPATSRLAGMVEWNVVLVAFLYLIPFGIALAWYDKQSLRRVHPLTVVGLACTVLIMVVPIGLLFAGASRLIVARLG